MRKKKCKGCDNYFRPPEDSPAVRHCSPECAQTILEKHWAKVRLQQERAREKAQKAKNAKFDRKYYANDIKTRRLAAIREFNKYIRWRDRDLSCISCDSLPHNAKRDCGHYINAGSCTALRFNEYNCNSQCSKNCNLELSGNLIEYRKGLLQKYGEKVVEFLEGPQPLINITVEFFKEVEMKYKALNKHP